MSDPKTMLAAQIMQHEKGGHYELKKVPIPDPGKGQILVKIQAAGLCHSDIQVIEGHYKPRLPLTGSHEPAGVIEALGEGVEGWQVGQRVGIACQFGGCGEGDSKDSARDGEPLCVACARGSFQRCQRPDYGAVGVFTPEQGYLPGDGGFAEYALSDPFWTVAIPDKIEMISAAPLMCAGMTIHGALISAELKQGDWVGIIGLGGLGHLGVQLARAMGYKVLALDARQEPLDLVLSHEDASLRPDAVVNTRDHGAVARALELTGGGVRTAIVATDALPAFSMASAITAMFGTVLCIGLPSEPIPVVSQDLIFRGIKVIGTVGSPHPDKVREMLQLVADRNIKVHTTAYPLAKINEMLDVYYSGDFTGRLVIDMALGAGDSAAEKDAV